MAYLVKTTKLEVNAVADKVFKQEFRTFGLAFRIQGCGCQFSGLGDFSENYAFLMYAISGITGFLWWQVDEIEF